MRDIEALKAGVEDFKGAGDGLAVRGEVHTYLLNSEQEYYTYSIQPGLGPLLELKHQFLEAIFWPLDSVFWGVGKCREQSVWSLYNA